VEIQHHSVWCLAVCFVYFVYFVCVVFAPMYEAKTDSSAVNRESGEKSAWHKTLVESHRVIHHHTFGQEYQGT